MTVIGVRAVLDELGWKQEQPTVILTDSKGSFESMKNPITTKLRHVNMRFHRVRQAIRDKEVIFRLVPSNSMIADIFTKSFTVADFERLRDLVMGYEDKPDLPVEILKGLKVKE